MVKNHPARTRAFLCAVSMGVVTAGAGLACGQDVTLGYPTEEEEFCGGPGILIGKYNLGGRITHMLDGLVTLSPTDWPRGTPTRVQPDPESAVVGFRSEGEIQPQATGEVTGSSYLIPCIRAPVGPETLVAIRDGDGRAVGRVLQLYKWENETILNEPVDAETSLEGAVYLGASLLSDDPYTLWAPGTHVALVHRFNEALAAELATSKTHLRTLVDATRRGRATFVLSLRAMGHDYFTRSGGTINRLRPSAQRYAESRNAGIRKSVAHETFVEEAVGAYTEDLGAHSVAIAWGVWAIVHHGVLADAQSPARLQSAQNLLRISVTARQALVTTVPDGAPGKPEVSAALDDILTAGMAARGMGGFVNAVAAEVEEGAEALQAARGSDLSTELQAADLSGHIDTSTSPEEIAAGLPDYLAGVESTADNSELVALVIALMGGPGYGGG